LPWRYDAEMV